MPRDSYSLERSLICTAKVMCVLGASFFAAQKTHQFISNGLKETTNRDRIHEALLKVHSDAPEIHGAKPTDTDVEMIIHLSSMFFALIAGCAIATMLFTCLCCCKKSNNVRGAIATEDTAEEDLPERAGLTHRHRVG